MAYNLKDVFYLDTSIETGTSTGDGVQVLDVSAYVDPIAKGRSKATGLAIYKCQFDIMDANSNDPVNAASTGQVRAGLSSFTGGLTSAAVGSASITDHYLTNDNDLMIAGFDYTCGGTAAGDPAPYQWLTPDKDVPYVVVRDSVMLAISIPVAMSAAARISVRMSCAQVTLDQATLNQLLRTQTV